MKNRILVLSILFMIFFEASSQEVKYSDLYVLLKNGQYQQAEPSLRMYLKETKTNPNAYLYMGRIFETKISSFKEQSKIQSCVDSAIYYYSLTISSITQKEINKNQMYYSPYQRRDLRTGKMEVKLSDIVFDIETRTENLKTLSRALGLPFFNDMLQNTQATKSPSEPEKIIQPKKIEGKFYAVIIGISNYDSSKLNLDSPVKDALELKNVLIKNYEFDESTIYSLLNPTRQQILLALYGLRKRISTVDNLLIFYAGHGFWDADVEQGYWWPRDASPIDPANWLSNSDIREQIRGIKSAHTLLISDACFSGGILKVRGASTIKDAPMDIVSLYKIPSRRAITSGTLTEVPDKSVFFSYLIKRLKENQEEFLTSQSLFDSFKKAVINNSLLVPQDGVIADTGDEGGDFIFIKRMK